MRKPFPRTVPWVGRIESQRACRMLLAVTRVVEEEQVPVVSDDEEPTYVRKPTVNGNGAVACVEDVTRLAPQFSCPRLPWGHEHSPVQRQRHAVLGCVRRREPAVYRFAHDTTGRPVAELAPRGKAALTVAKGRGSTTLAVATDAQLPPGRVLDSTRT